MDQEQNKVSALDFGAGNIIALPSRCLRVAKQASNCDICAQACPAAAINLKALNTVTPEEESATILVVKGGAYEKDADAKSVEPEVKKPGSNARATLEKKLGVEIDNDACIHCGVCITVCPVEALSAAKYNTKSFSKDLKTQADRFEGVSLSCARSLYGIPKRFASRAISLPCLAAVSVEGWFMAASLARDAIIDPRIINGSNIEDLEDDANIFGTLKIYLPPLLCSNCPVNITGDAEEVYEGAITQAEAWGATNIELIDKPEDLGHSYSGKLMSALNELTTGDKRELVQQLASGFSRSWQSAGQDLNHDKIKAELLAKRRKKVHLSPPLNLNAPRPFGKKSQKRQLLRSALEQNKILVNDVELLCASTEIALCVDCGNCVAACPLAARKRISSNSVLYFGKLPEDKRPKEKHAAVTDQLCCLGCSACVQACEVGACTLSLLSGSDFMKLRQN